MTLNGEKTEPSIRTQKVFEMRQTHAPCFTWSDTVKFQKTDKQKIEVPSRGKWQLQVNRP